MQNPGDYRVISRRKFAALMVIPLALTTVGVWESLDRLAEYTKGLEDLAASKPLEAAAAARELLQQLALLNGVVFCAFAALIIRHGWRGWKTASMPPRGSWILEGQRVWTGEPATRIARFTIVVGTILAVLGVASSLILWNLSDTLLDAGQAGTAASVTPLASRDPPALSFG